MIRLRIKEIATQKHMGQMLLGRLANIDVKTMQRIFRNPYTTVTTATLDRLATALHVDASLLIESEPVLPKTLEEWSESEN